MATSSSDKPISWSELPPEITSSIMLRLGVEEILESAQKVCRSWRRISKDPSMWRKIDMRYVGSRESSDHKFYRICRMAIDRSEGGLVEIKLGIFASDSLLNYLVGRSSNLRSLTLIMEYSSLTNEGLVNAVAKLPLLEEVEILNLLSKLDLKAVGHSCPRLTTLKIQCSYDYFRSDSEGDDEALAIAESMPQLQHLQLIRMTKLTDSGLNAILDNCPHLEHLDLRKCFKVKLVGELEKRCIQRIKDFRRPNDSIDDIQFELNFLEDCLDNFSSEEDDLGYIYGRDDGIDESYCRSI